MKRHSQDFWAGLLFLGFGLVALVMAWPYPSGLLLLIVAPTMRKKRETVFAENK